jgi:hypothetical protein
MTSSTEPAIQEFYKRPLSPQVVEGYLLHMIRGLFTRAADIDDPFLRQSNPELQMSSTYVWRRDDQTNEQILTGIQIGSLPKNLQDLAIATLLPTIRVGASAVSVGPNLGIGSRSQFSNRLPGAPVPGGTANEQYERNASFDDVHTVISGNTPIVVIANEPGETAQLGWYVWSALCDFRKIIRRDMQLMSFKVGALNPVGKLAGAGENGPAVQPFIVEWSFHRVIQLTENAPLIAQISPAITPTTRS